MPIVTTLRQFTYRERTYTRGDPVEMDPTDALVHARQGHITLSKQVQTRAMTPDPEPVVIDSPLPRRRYRRRDLQAE